MAMVQVRPVERVFSGFNPSPNTLFPVTLKIWRKKKRCKVAYRIVNTENTINKTEQWSCVKPKIASLAHLLKKMSESTEKNKCKVWDSVWDGLGTENQKMDFSTFKRDDRWSRVLAECKMRRWESCLLFNTETFIANLLRSKSKWRTGNWRKFKRHWLTFTNYWKMS